MHDWTTLTYNIIELEHAQWKQYLAYHQFNNAGNLLRRLYRYRHLEILAWTTTTTTTADEQTKVQSSKTVFLAHARGG